MSTRRRDLVILFVVVLAAATLQIGPALRLDLGYDETWHVFFGEVQPFDLFLSEVRRDTHPPLSYLILRAALAIDSHPLTARLTSILPGLVSLPVLFMGARLAGVGATPAHLGTLVLALSHSYTSVSVPVRSYMLAQLGMLLALAAWMRCLRDPERTSSKAALIMAVCAVASVFSHYVYGFAILAMLALPVVLAAGGGHCAVTLSRLCGRTGVRVAAALLLTGAAGVLVWYRGSRPRTPRGYLPQYFPRPDEGLLDFAARGVGDEIGLLLPFHPGTGTVAVVLAGMLALGLAALAVRALRSADGLGRAVLALLAPAMAAILFVLALAGRYPFGGELRHQAVMLPLAVLAFTVVLNALWTRVHTRSGRGVLAGLVIAGIVASTASHAGEDPLDDLPRAPRWSDAVAGVQRLREPGWPIWVNGFGFVPFYGEARERVWRLAGRPLERCERYLVESDPTRTLLRDRSRWLVPAPCDVALAERFAALLERLQVPAMVVLSLWPECEPRLQDEASLRVTMRAAKLHLGQQRRYENGAAFIVRRE